jgi:hypothetical protein
MARTARYVILAEDRAGMRFVEQYLIERGIDSREIRSRHAPPGKGSGKQWVTQEYPMEVRALRAKIHVWKALLVATDADELSVAERKDQLADALAAQALAARSPDEHIALVVPRWEIETWAEHLLRGTDVSEDDGMGWSVSQSERECHAAGRLLRAHRQEPEPAPTCCPPSLKASDAELARVD